ncbi:hypothetical protein BJ875DRAFT_41253 [Amylocarpus encephaloides]|uniref:Uncharacterized protein n=1 Tax=Amylocarpus encephaloides TaxID=45428 RepID=A0A9P7YSP4_9HELO|nr:hypothetical protein BJ875DRAFT_41253 [Amylocarpus encephaloides]
MQQNARWVVLSLNSVTGAESLSGTPYCGGTRCLNFAVCFQGKETNLRSAGCRSLSSQMSIGMKVKPHRDAYLRCVFHHETNEGVLISRTHKAFVLEEKIRGTRVKTRRVVPQIFEKLVVSSNQRGWTADTWRRDVKTGKCEYRDTMHEGPAMASGAKDSKAGWDGKLKLMKLIYDVCRVCTVDRNSETATPNPGPTPRVRLACCGCCRVTEIKRVEEGARRKKGFLES